MTHGSTVSARGESPAKVALRLCNGREVQHNGGAAAELAFSLHAPAVCLHEVLDDRQAEPRAAFLPRAAGVHTVEALEDAREVLGGDAGAGVGHPNDDVAAVSLRGHADTATPRRMPQRVIKEICEDLLQRVGIAAD